MVKKVIVLSIAILSMLAVSSTALAEGFFRSFGDWQGGKMGFAVVVDETNLNVRSGPGTQYYILEEVPYGAVMWLPNSAPNYGVGQGWIQVAADNGERGWVSANLLEPVKVFSVDNYYGSLYGVVNSDDCNVRKGASTKCTITGKVNTGTKVMVRAAANGWFYIVPQYGRAGWISAGYINMIGRTNTTGQFVFF